MDNLPRDIKIWIKDPYVSNFLEEKGAKLLKEESVIDLIYSGVKDELKRESFEFKAVFEMIKNITFIAKDSSHNLIGYWHGKDNDISIEESFVVYYNTQEIDFYLKIGSIIESIILDYSEYKKEFYNKYKDELLKYKLELRDYEAVTQNGDELFTKIEDELFELHSEIEEVLEKGRELKEKKSYISHELFMQWREPRFGKKNPEKIESKVWEYALTSRKAAYWLNDEFKGPNFYNDPENIGAGWCFDRFGKSVTFMPDGREIHIAGEHEDHYDPDFHIYNDVTVIYPDESIEFYIYPEDVFMPTDFHTATLIDDMIIIIGNLGYGNNTKVGTTPIYLLDTNSYKITSIKSSGESPGWIHEHYSILSEDKKSIKIIGGKVNIGKEHNLVENIDEWALDIESWKWERLTDRDWARFEISRKDKKENHLWDIRQTISDRDLNLGYKKSKKRLIKSMGYEVNLEIIKELYSFDFEHESVSKDEYNVFFIYIDGVKVRFVENHDYLLVVFEGVIDNRYINSIKQHLLDKLGELERTKWEINSV